jgi:hypothetical protein
MNQSWRMVLIWTAVLAAGLALVFFGLDFFGG